MRGRLLRGEEVLTYDISRDHPAAPYRVHVLQPDGTETVVVLERATDLIEHIDALMNRLRADGWSLDPS